ncbi:hypothetical protein JOB18_004331 [Solea senegalensis]|uniref:Uncharacterized protein n=1 Tax=Solea senegalensis TaxID=28829 RepID=A0AAV6S9S2_SOLSE|nr:hypothetical protein JOB18_004331 [Solea senegalensis]
MECAALNRDGAGLAKPPKHLWRQPRTHIRIKQRFNSDTERYLCRNRTLEKLRPGLRKPRMSWPSSMKRVFLCFSIVDVSEKYNTLSTNADLPHLDSVRVVKGKLRGTR